MVRQTVKLWEDTEINTFFSSQGQGFYKRKLSKGTEGEVREEGGNTVSMAPSGLEIFEVRPDPQQGVVGDRRSREKSR